jgi:hypothetical protein
MLVAKKSNRLSVRKPKHRYKKGEMLHIHFENCQLNIGYRAQEAKFFPKMP